MSRSAPSEPRSANLSQRPSACIARALLVRGVGAVISRLAAPGLAALGAHEVGEAPDRGVISLELQGPHDQVLISRSSASAPFTLLPLLEEFFQYRSQSPCRKRSCLARDWILERASVQRSPSIQERARRHSSLRTGPEEDAERRAEMALWAGSASSRSRGAPARSRSTACPPSRSPLDAPAV